jgi:hypothetical protein
MEQQSGTEPSLTDDDITNYLNRVISEVKQKKGEDIAAEVVGSNPTRSIFINLVKYGIELNSILTNVGQILWQCQ